MLKLYKNYDNYNPSKYFNENYGKTNSGKELKEFLCEHIIELKDGCSNTEYLNLKV